MRVALPALTVRRACLSDLVELGRHAGRPMPAADDSPRTAALVDAYLHRYAQFGPCPGCDAGRSFTWGIQHGAGHCDACGYIGRAYHSVRHGGSLLWQATCILWYHPEELRDGGGRVPLGTLRERFAASAERARARRWRYHSRGTF